MKFLLQTIDKKIVHDFGFALTQSKDYINWVNDSYAMTIRKHEGLDFSGIKSPSKYIPVGSVDFVSAYLSKIWD